MNTGASAAIVLIITSFTLGCASTHEPRPVTPPAVAQLDTTRSTPENLPRIGSITIVT